MEDEKTIGEQMESARLLPRPGKPRGDTIREACDSIGIVPDTFHRIKRGDVVRVHSLTRKSIEKYIAKAKRENDKVRPAKAD